MAGGRWELTIDGLDTWQRWLLRLSSSEVTNTKGRIVRKAGLQTLAHLDDLTPVRTGRLKGSMTMGDRDNVFNIQVGQTSFVFVGTAVSYAQYINDGFTQKAGQFVPGFWRNGTFHYTPKALAQALGIKGGMVLTGKVIAGAHMFEKALERLEDDLPEIMDFEFRRLFELLFRS